MTTPKTVIAEAPTPDKSQTLLLKAPPGKTDDRVHTDLVTTGLVTNASTAMRFVQHERGALSLTDMVESLREHGEAVNRGDLSSAERMLSAQAVALNAIFGEMARRAALNMGERLSATEAYMRLALKAQGQCRATVETLAALKNPPVVFARQANFASGPQQVNNGQPSMQSGTRALENQNAPNELIENLPHACTPMDTGAAPAAVRAHPSLEPLGALHRPEER